MLRALGQGANHPLASFCRDPDEEAFLLLLHRFRSCSQIDRSRLGMQSCSGIRHPSPACHGRSRSLQPPWHGPQSALWPVAGAQPQTPAAQLVIPAYAHPNRYISGGRSRRTHTHFIAVPWHRTPPASGSTSSGLPTRRYLVGRLQQQQYSASSEPSGGVDVGAARPAVSQGQRPLLSIPRIGAAAGGGAGLQRLPSEDAEPHIGQADGRRQRRRLR